LDKSRVAIAVVDVQAALSSFVFLRSYVTKAPARVKDKGDAVADAPKPIRRVVTGNDAAGRSRVLFDSAAPNVNPGAVVRGTAMTSRASACCCSTAARS
jgi:hypothetical protein